MAKRYLLNPCALPAGTSGRFHMLIAAALLATWGLPALFIEIPLPSVSETTPQIISLTTHLLLHGVENSSDPDLAELSQWAQTHGGNAMDRRLLLLASSVGLFLAHLTVGALLLSARRKQIRRRNRLLTPEKLPGLLDALRALLRRLQFPRFPELRQGAGWLDGEAHGDRTGAIIVLRGFRLEKTWSPFHQVTLYHELAHIHAGDSQPRELARVLWVVAACSTGLALVSLPLFGMSGLSWPIALRLLLPIALGSLVWSELVRHRELFADARVAEWGFRSTLLRRLDLPESFGQEIEEKRSWTSFLSSHLKSQLGKHPSNAERRRTLENPSLLFSQLTLRQTVAAGLATGLLASQIATIAELCFLFIGFITAILSFIVPTLGAILIGFYAVFGFLLCILTHFLTANLGQQTLRLAIVDLETGYPLARRYCKLLGIAGLYILALEVALWIFGEPPRNLVAQKLQLAWAGFAIISTFLWLVQTYSSGRKILGAPRPAPPSKLLAMAQTFSTIQLTLLAIPALIFRLMLAGTERFYPTRLQREYEDILADFPANLTAIALAAALPSLCIWLAGSLAHLAVAFASGIWANRMCQSCGHSSLPGNRPALVCQNCNTPLARWLFIEADRSES